MIILETSGVTHATAHATGRAYGVRTIFVYDYVRNTISYSGPHRKRGTYCKQTKGYSHS